MDRQPRRSIPRRFGLVLFAAMLATIIATPGCAFFQRKQIGVKRVPPRDKSVLGIKGHLIDHLSDRSRQTIRESGLEKLYTRSPADAAISLHEDTLEEPTPEKLFALAEIHARLAHSMGPIRRQDALGHHYLAAGYAYHFLVANCSDALRHGYKETGGMPGWPKPVGMGNNDRMMQPQDIYDPRFIQACELYNRNLSQLVRSIPLQTWKVGLRRGGQALTLTMESRHPDVSNGRITSLIPCNELKVTGMRNHHHSYGLGVPLLVESASAEPSHFPNIHVGQKVLAATAFLRYSDRLEDLRVGAAPTIEIHDPIREPNLHVHGRIIPLEADTTTVLAASLARSGLEGLDYSAYLFGNNFSDRFGLYLLEPYQPGKIPVVLVHGLLSSPITWAPVVNDLMADKDFRERYQIWAYFYPTALPFLLPAADLRDKLHVVRNQLDPEQTDKALENMVLVGHSMGGLISRILTVDSADTFWSAVSERPFESLDFPNEQSRRELRRLFFFEKHPLVSRAIFIAAPFGGSTLSPSPVGRLAASVPSLPPQLRELASTLGNLDPSLNKRMAGHVPTSVELLNPENRVLQALAQSEPREVTWHAIAGHETACFGPLYRALLEINKQDTGDGVVGLNSALLVPADSKLVVPAGHTTVHQEPRAVREIRRILRVHAEETGWFGPNAEAKKEKTDPRKRISAQPDAIATGP